jgi:hypothetical protein
MKRADSNSIALLTALGLLLTVLLGTVPGHHLHPLTIVLMAASGIPLALAGGRVLRVLKPVLDTESEGRGSWVYWARCTPAELAEDLATGDPGQHLRNLSRIADKKFGALRAAVGAVQISAGVLAAALICALIGW